MLSLNARLLIAASVVLVAFLGLTGLTLDQAFRESALSAVRDRLQGQINMLLGVADQDDNGDLVLPDVLPEVRFSTVGSGLYARVVDSEGRVLWRSSSLLGLDLPPLAKGAELGKWRFHQLKDSAGSRLFALDLNVSWETVPDTYRQYTFEVAETRQGFDSQVGDFRRSLWVWFVGIAVVLLLVQGAILRWSLKPLRQVVEELMEIEDGQRTHLSGSYPKELQALTLNLNGLIHHSQAHLERYRNALGDLAHSLKTPLAVLRGAIAGESLPLETRATLQEQVERMNSTVEYQLQRAAASGRTVLTAPVPVAPVARKILEALAKVYGQRSLELQCRIDADLVFHGDEGDLMEVIGNLADNACKWARSRVIVRACRAAVSHPRKPGLVIEVEDDGPGLPEAQKQTILGRGIRADQNTAGHGIGLAVVRDIVEDVYQGVLELGRGELGGACIRVELP